MNTGLLQRCPFTGTNPCRTSNPDWPINADVLFSLSLPEFDHPPYNIFTRISFRTFNDFQNGNLSIGQCREDRQCRCIPSLDPLCGIASEITSKSGMHFLVSGITNA